MKSRLIALNVHDALSRLVEGSCDVLISRHHPSQPFQLAADRYEMVSLGNEVVPYVKPDGDREGAPRYRSPGRLDRVYETDMAEGLKETRERGESRDGAARSHDGDSRLPRKTDAGGATRSAEENDCPWFPQYLLQAGTLPTGAADALWTFLVGVSTI